MRTIAAVVAMALIPALGWSQVPGQLGYQGRLLKADGTPESGVVPITFAIFAAPEGGGALWTEERDDLVLSDGYYSLFLGSKTPFPASLFDGSARYLELTVAELALSPRQEIRSVAYAMLAGNATALGGLTTNASGMLVYNGTPIVNTDGTWAGSSTGLGGPKGDAGPKGDPGASVYGVSLAPGADPTCPNGGSKFTAAGGTITYACNGSSGGAGAWAVSGADVYRASGNVGIGTSSPGALLHVSAANTSPEITPASGVSADSSASGYPATNAFDGNVNTLWGSGSASATHTLTYDFGAGADRVVATYTLTYNSSVGGWAGYVFSPNSWAFQGSNNGTSWTVLDTQSNQAWTADGPKTYSFPNTTSYRYYQLANITAKASNSVAIAELTMLRGNDDMLMVKNGQVTVGSANPNLQTTPKLAVDGMVGATKYCDATGANCVTPWGGSPLYIYPRSGICAAFLGTSPTCQTVSCNTTCYYDCAGGCCPLNDCMTFGCSSSTPQACAGTYVGHLMP